MLMIYNDVIRYNMIADVCVYLLYDYIYMVHKPIQYVDICITHMTCVYLICG